MPEQEQTIMMQCGHAANATTEIEGQRVPCCAICAGSVESFTPEDREIDLSKRQSKCSYCSVTEPSSTDLPFFEYLGPGSHHSQTTCINCGRHKNFHSKDHWAYKEGQCIDFRPGHVREYDNHYNGCRGFD
jgi:hypothetical protein